MFGKKKKKSPKVENVLESSSAEEQASAANNEQEPKPEEKRSDVDDFLGVEEQPEDDALTEQQKEKVEQLNSVKSKISQILKSSNIEIIDENIGDEYEYDGSAGSEKKSQQDYDSLKALFGDKDANKKQELTLTIDDFDYTYVGQYLDEFDLMHMKNIKRIRLQRKYPKHLKKILIIASAVLVVGLGVFLGVYFTRDIPVYLKNVTLSQTEHDYFIDEVFDYTGLYLIAEYSDGSTKRIKLDNSHLKDITGWVERVGDNSQDIQFVNGSAATLTFNYQGFDVNYTVNIVKKVESGLMAIHSNGLFDIAENGHISSNFVTLFVDYGNFGMQEIKLSATNVACYVDGEKCTYQTSKGFLVTNGTNKNSVIKFEYTTEKNEIISLTVPCEEGQNIVSVKK